MQPCKWNPEVSDTSGDAIHAAAGNLTIIIEGFIMPAQQHPAQAGAHAVYTICLSGLLFLIQLFWKAFVNRL